MGSRDQKRGQRGGPPTGRRRRRGPAPRAGALTPQRVLRVFAKRERPLLAATAVLRELGLGRDCVHPLRELLESLEASGRLEQVGRRYRLRRRDGHVEGLFEPAEDARGGGRVLTEEGVVWRVPDAGGARSGDRVLLQAVGDARRGDGEILSVLVGRRDVWVGIYQQRGRRGSVVPYRDDAEWSIEIAATDANDARSGDVVVVQPTQPARGAARKRAARPRNRPQAARLTGRVTEVLGPPGTPEADFRAIVWRRRLPFDFPEAVTAAAEALPAQPPADEIARRVDLRDRDFVTIDPASARDHDDALCVEPLANDRFRLWIAIADVAHFVPPGSPIDREALLRGNSIYFPHRAIPMLPERLSGNLCSLRPGADRLVLVVELLVGPKGEVERRDFYPGVIRSRAHLVYGDVAPVMRGESDGDLPPALVAQLRELARVTKALRTRRLAAGSIDLEIPEARIVFGDDGLVADVVAAQRSVAHRAVEDAMLAANRAVAELLVKTETAALHRNHEPPLPHDADALRELFAMYGLDERPKRGGARDAAGEITSGWIAAALSRVRGRPEERSVHETVLRSMTRALYGAEARGHFALGFSQYTHFTSPIRRYADLVVHRALAGVIAAGDGSASGARRARHARQDGPNDHDRMKQVAGRVSWRERVAVEAEREAVDLQKCAFLLPRVGECFGASMTGASPFGLWLTLDDHFVQGLVHVSSLPDFVEYDEKRHAFRALRSGERFELGDRFEIRVEAVDIVRARVDFRIVGRRPPPDQSPAIRRSRSSASL